MDKTAKEVIDRCTGTCRICGCRCQAPFFRESGNIEQDADVIAFLYRDDYYDREAENKNSLEVILAKQRNEEII